MATQMTPDLYKAILAMDSYNRGYGASIKFGNLAGTVSIDIPDTKIGAATIFRAKGDSSAQSIGFYGIAYKLANGETVISYRGTDFLTGDGTLGIGSDIVNGYGTGLGHESTMQSNMAIGFYKDVATSLNNNIAIDPRLANISLTGHSLGAGIAGYVGSLYGKIGVLFDNMPFEDAEGLHIQNHR